MIPSRNRSSLVALGAAWLFAACAAKPVTAPRIVIPETVPSEVRVAAAAADSFGNVTPVAVGVTNGSQNEYRVSAERVFAIDEKGRRIAPLAVEEAIRQAGGATALLAGLRGAGGGALLAGVLGAATGAVVGAGTGNPGKGAAVGGGIGAAAGALSGFFESKNKTELEIADQIRSISLGEQTLKPALPVSGFVFFPRGKYTGVQVLAIDEKTGRVEEFYGSVSR